MVEVLGAFLGGLAGSFLATWLFRGSGKSLKSAINEPTSMSKHYEEPIPVRKTVYRDKEIVAEEESLQSAK